MAVLRFAQGTLELTGWTESMPPPKAFAFDARSSSHRAPAVAYADIVRTLRRARISFADEARGYGEISPDPRSLEVLRPYQAEALAAWRADGGRGVVVLPTGAGKTLLAMRAIEDRKRSTLVIAPTLDLVRQWYDGLRARFASAIGLIGGGEYDIQPISVATYDSACIHMEHLGARFGLLVFDECHHLPGNSYSLCARFSLAPFRLGLTATPERADGRDALLLELIGKTVYRKDIVELEGDYLSAYDTHCIEVELSDEDRSEYERTRATYRAFLAKHGIRIGAQGGWSEFIMRASRGEEGRLALSAYRRQRALAFGAPAKIEALEALLARHRADRTLVFTSDNATAYVIARRFLVPVITHQTRVRERSEILAGFSEGRYGVVATSRVLNEGIDLPLANVAVVISGSGSVREHVQRLGRILRKAEGKRAILYELVTARTVEGFTSERRRAHSAYR